MDLDGKTLRKIWEHDQKFKDFISEDIVEESKHGAAIELTFRQEKALKF